MGSGIRGDGRIDWKVFLLDPRGRIGGHGMLVRMGGVVLRMPVVCIEEGDVLVVVNGDMDVLWRIDDDILEEIVTMSGIDGRAVG